MKLFLIPLAVLMTFAALSVPLPARAESDLDPFYQARLDEGKALHLRGDIPGSIQALEIASFGFLDHPEKLLGCSVYLLLGYHRTNDAAGESRCRGEIERLAARTPLSSLFLPAPVRTAYEEISGLRPKASAPKGPVVKPPTPVLRIPVFPPVPTPLFAGAPFIVRARAEARLNEKIRFYRLALEADPADPFILLEMSAAYAGAKKYREAAKIVERLLSARPGSVPLRLKLAEILVEDKSYLKAFRTLTPAAAGDPENVEIRYLLGRSYFGLRDYAKAAIEFNYVLHRVPAHKEAAAFRRACADKGF
mgnify:FL=1